MRLVPWASLYLFHVSCSIVLSFSRSSGSSFSIISFISVSCAVVHFHFPSSLYLLSGSGFRTASIAPVGYLLTSFGPTRSSSMSLLQSFPVLKLAANLSNDFPKDVFISGHVSVTQSPVLTVLRGA